MPGINEMIRRAQALDLKEVVQVSVVSTVQEYEQLQKFQMLTGQDSKGNKLGKYKNRKYAEKKFAMNPLAGFGNMDFRLSGDFFKEFFTRAGTNSVFISSGNNKTERLLKINKDAFGLNKMNLSEYSVHHMGPKANELVKKQLHGG